MLPNTFFFRFARSRALQTSSSVCASNGSTLYLRNLCQGKHYYGWLTWWCLGIGLDPGVSQLLRISGQPALFRWYSPANIGPVLIKIWLLNDFELHHRRLLSRSGARPSWEEWRSRKTCRPLSCPQSQPGCGGRQCKNGNNIVSYSFFLLDTQSLCSPWCLPQCAHWCPAVQGEGPDDIGSWRKTSEFHLVLQGFRHCFKGLWNYC